MGSHRTTIKRKRPLTQRTLPRANRKVTIKALHNDLKAQLPRDAAALATYQQASSRGQDPNHGGDSSKVLVPWLRGERPLRVLEIGCLECDNAIAKFVESRGGAMKRIDLKSRDPRIEEVDFMSFPVPAEVSSPFKDFVDGEKFDLISLSLVLNFFPSPQARYEMLKRTKLFLRQKSESERLPMLFVVLPLPCVANSRYLTRERFLDIMASLGYHLLHSKESKRMAYWLFQWSGRVEERAWKKEILNDGRGRNNFAICNN